MFSALVEGTLAELLGLEGLQEGTCWIDDVSQVWAWPARAYDVYDFNVRLPGNVVVAS